MLRIFPRWEPSEDPPLGQWAHRWSADTPAAHPRDSVGKHQSLNGHSREKHPLSFVNKKPLRHGVTTHIHTFVVQIKCHLSLPRRGPRQYHCLDPERIKSRCPLKQLLTPQDLERLPRERTVHCSVWKKSWNKQRTGHNEEEMAEKRMKIKERK